MIELYEIKEACNRLLSDTFPGVKIYGADSASGIKRPAFYTEIVPYTFRRESKNFASQSAGFKISILRETADEPADLMAFAKIREAFGMKLGVKERKINVSDISFDYTGKNSDIFQMTIRFSWMENTRKPEIGDLMETVETKTIMKGE